MCLERPPDLTGKLLQRKLILVSLEPSWEGQAAMVCWFSHSTIYCSSGATYRSKLRATVTRLMPLGLFHDRGCYCCMDHMIQAHNRSGTVQSSAQSEHAIPDSEFCYFLQQTSSDDGYPVQALKDTIPTREQVSLVFISWPLADRLNNLNDVSRHKAANHKTGPGSCEIGRRRKGPVRVTAGSIDLLM